MGFWRLRSANCGFLAVEIDESLCGFLESLNDSQSFEKQFVSKLLALGRLRHYNTMPLLGYHIERKEKLLVNKYISNCNLYDWLHATKGQHKIL